MSPFSADDNGSNVFHSLAALGQPKLVQKTLSTTQKKVVATGLSSKDKNGRTPLHIAAYCGNIKVLRLFLDVYPEAGDIRDGNGNNARDALRRPEALASGDPTSQKCFQRLLNMGKLGYEHQDFEHEPMDIWDVAMSNNSTVVAAQPTWNEKGESRQLYAIIKGTLRHLRLGDGDVPRYVATSNVHSLVLTADKCFAWGKNINGLLGIDSDEKIVTEPKVLDESFVEYLEPEQNNAFSALGRSSNSRERIKEPLIGVACCDFYSLCYTTGKVWSWGVNRGQMMNKAPKNTVVDTPVLVYQSATRISTVKCCDNAVCILLTNGQVQLLHNSRISRLQVGKTSREVKAIAACGDNLVVQTDQGKLLKYSLKPSDIDKNESSVLWTPRKPKDEVVAFDVADNGSAIVATRSSIVKVEEGKDLTELKVLRGMPICKVKTDPQFRAFIGVSNLLAGLSYDALKGHSWQLKSSAAAYTHWENVGSTETDEDGDLFLSIGNSTVCVHKSVLYARCPSLRPLIESMVNRDNGKTLVAVPGGSTVFRLADSGNSVVIEYASMEAVSLFVASLYYSQDEPKPQFDLYMEPGPILHEYNALQRLITCDLGTGMWDAREANIGCDVTLSTGLAAHSSILAATSPVIAAQIKRWPGKMLDYPAYSSKTSFDVMKYAYTMKLDGTKSFTSEPEEAQWLFDVWQVADELLMHNLSEECEQRLFEMLNFEYVLPFLQACPLSSRLFASLLDILVRHLPFFVQSIGELGSETLDAVERSFKATLGTEKADKDLMDAYELLKGRLNPPKSASSGKKARTASSTSTQPQLGNDVPTASHSPGQSSKPTGVSLENHQESAIFTHGNAKTVAPTVPLIQKPQREAGWIPARRKSRNNNENEILPRLSVESPSIPLARPQVYSSPMASSSSIPTPSASSSPAATSSRSSPWATQTPPRTPAWSSGTSRSGSPATPSPAMAPQAANLSDNLPSLGAKPRTASGAKGPRPKFNSKNSKQFDSTLLFTENLDRERNSQGPSTPWKQIPKDVQTSQSVLEKLERAHQINSRKMTGGSVWGL